MKNKKGQGININVIIISAIALLVLVILAVLLVRSGNNSAKENNIEDETIITEIYTYDFDDYNIDCDDIGFMMQTGFFPDGLLKVKEVFKNETEDIIRSSSSNYGQDDFIKYYFRSCMEVDYGVMQE